MSDQTPPPAGDQDPISGGQPPPADAPPPPPVNPYETPAAPVPPPVDPAAPPPPPPYGTEQPGYTQPAAPQYGTPQYGGTPAYGTPPPAQPGMTAGYPGMPGVPVEAQPSKAMAIIALIASILCCTPLGFILAIVVIVRSKDGKNHGKGLAIAALIISILFSIGIAAGAYALTKVDWNDFLPVEQLKSGECFDANNLTDDEADFVDDITEKPCTDPHDAEVLVTKTLTQDDAESYNAASSTLCSELIAADPDAVAKIQSPDIGTFGLTQGAEPNAGDKLVCVAYRVDGTKLDAPL